jgi:trimethylamine:corrinoid methyltransferase-like protein
MAGISASFSFSGALAMTHAEVLFGICAAQLLNPGLICIHGGFPTIANPRIEYNPNYGLKSHSLLSILMSHLNLTLDTPTCQSACRPHEEHLTPKAFEDAKNGHAKRMKYGVHMIRHSFAFLRYLIDFSIEKLEQGIMVFENTTAKDAPEVEMPAYDECGVVSIMNTGLEMYLEDPLTIANMGKIFMSRSTMN